MTAVPVPEEQRSTIRTVVRRAAEGKRLVVVTAYDYPSGRICDQADVDVVLVGDSLGNVVLGLPDTLAVTMDDMVRHTAAVSRGVHHALLVADMPFLSYQPSPGLAVENAGRLLQAGAQAVKLEGGAYFAPTIRHIVESGIPVMAHIGYTPQSIHRLGGPRVQGRGTEGRQRLLEDAVAVAEAGAWSLVLEMVPGPIAGEVTAAVGIPTIGIGAGPHCRGQVLVLHDIVGLSGRAPRFARQYVDGERLLTDAVIRYADDVRQGRFPGPEHTHDGEHWGSVTDGEGPR